MENDPEWSHNECRISPVFTNECRLSKNLTFVHLSDLYLCQNLKKSDIRAPVRIVPMSESDIGTSEKKHWCDLSRGGCGTRLKTLKLGMYQLYFLRPPPPCCPEEHYKGGFWKSALRGRFGALQEGGFWKGVWVS